MPCIPIPGGFACTGRSRRRYCSVPGCNAPSEFQCDFPLRGKAAGRKCSKHLCRAHRVRIEDRQATLLPASVGTDAIDYCPAHARLAKGQTP